MQSKITFFTLFIPFLFFPHVYLNIRSEQNILAIPNKYGKIKLIEIEFSEEEDGEKVKIEIEIGEEMKDIIIFISNPHCYFNENELYDTKDFEIVEGKMRMTVEEENFGGYRGLRNICLFKSENEEGIASWAINTSYESS
uniref:Uncharacterized protein n=1 Tax=Meloidogyne hapla TaxID=6305 RepID=A0A1I8C0G6_MELHA